MFFSRWSIGPKSAVAPCLAMPTPLSISDKEVAFLLCFQCPRILCFGILFVGHEEWMVFHHRSNVKDIYIYIYYNVHMCTTQDSLPGLCMCNIIFGISTRILDSPTRPQHIMQLQLELGRINTTPGHRS